jgi:RNA polymerase sigma factor (TIGR02999 family)
MSSMKPDDAKTPMRADVTDLLSRWRQGDEGAVAELMPAVYGELHRLAHRAMRGERGDHTLQATALVHEAYLRLADGAAPAWRDRVHFFAVAARTMRRILVDHARRLKAARRGGGAPQVTLAEDAAPAPPPTVDLLDLDDALAELAHRDARKARVVELYLFAGLTAAETAAVLEVSEPTVRLDARLARAWLLDRLHRPAGEARAASAQAVGTAAGGTDSSDPPGRASP